MATEKFEKSNGVDPLEIKEPVPVEAAAREIAYFLFNNPKKDGPFGADRFTLDQLKEKFFARGMEDDASPLPQSVFPAALDYLREQGLLGFDKETNTYYNKESA